jgi:hypothetical protein
MAAEGRPRPEHLLAPPASADAHHAPRRAQLFLVSKLALGFGTTNDPCACIGNQGKAEQQDYYPVNMGDFCAPWDGTMDYCKDYWAGEDASASWCADPWCYTSEHCEGAAAGSYFAEQEGPQLFYNYAVCGAEDSYTGTDDDPNSRLRK